MNTIPTTDWMLVGKMFCELWMVSEDADVLGQNLPNYLLTWMAVMDSLQVGVLGEGNSHCAASRCNEQCKERDQGMVLC